MVNGDYHLRKKGDPILRQRCTEVTDFSGVEEIVKAMRSIVEADSLGAALSAPQIGVPKRIVVMKLSGGVKEFVNPVITESYGLSLPIETCSSLGLMGTRIKLRSRAIDLEYQDMYGNKHLGFYMGYFSARLEHEIDHLDGKLITG